jgi:hypothetical protein
MDSDIDIFSDIGIRGVNLGCLISAAERVNDNAHLWTLSCLVWEQEKMTLKNWKSNISQLDCLRS